MVLLDDYLLMLIKMETGPQQKMEKRIILDKLLLLTMYRYQKKMLLLMFLVLNQSQHHPSETCIFNPIMPSLYHCHITSYNCKNILRFFYK